MIAKNCHRWLRRRPIHPCLISCKSVHGGRFPEMVEYSKYLLSTRINSLRLTGQTRWQIFALDTSDDAYTCKCSFWGSHWYCFSSRLWGQTPIILILGGELGVSSETHKILKLVYYRNYCINSNQIFHRNKILFVSGANTRTNPRWWTAATFKNRHISATVWPIAKKFDKVTHIGIRNTTGHSKPEFKKSKIADGRHLQNRKIAKKYRQHFFFTPPSGVQSPSPNKIGMHH